MRRGGRMSVDECDDMMMMMMMMMMMDDVWMDEE